MLFISIDKSVFIKFKSRFDGDIDEKQKCQFFCGHGVFVLCIMCEFHHVKVLLGYCWGSVVVLLGCWWDVVWVLLGVMYLGYCFQKFHHVIE